MLQMASPHLSSILKLRLLSDKMGPVRNKAVFSDGIHPIRRERRSRVEVIGVKRDKGVPQLWFQPHGLGRAGAGTFSGAPAERLGGGWPLLARGSGIWALWLEARPLSRGGRSFKQRASRRAFPSKDLGKENLCMEYEVRVRQKTHRGKKPRKPAAHRRLYECRFQERASL